MGGRQLPDWQSTRLGHLPHPASWMQPVGAAFPRAAPWFPEVHDGAAAGVVRERCRSDGSRDPRRTRPTPPTFVRNTNLRRHGRACRPSYESKRIATAHQRHAGGVRRRSDVGATAVATHAVHNHAPHTLARSANLRHHGRACRPSYSSQRSRGGGAEACAPSRNAARTRTAARSASAALRAWIKASGSPWRSCSPQPRTAARPTA